MIIKNITLKHVILLFLLSYVFLMLGNGVLDLTNPDEVFYTQTAKEMVQHKTWTVPYLFGQPQFEKPIFTYWCLRLGFILFGVTSFSARFFCALFGIIGVLTLYGLGILGFGDKKKAFISSVILMSGGLYIGLSRTVFTDMIFSVLILLSMVSFFWGYARADKKALGILLFFVFSGLAVLAKGPLGAILPMLSVVLFLGMRKELKFFFCRYSAWGFLLFCLIAIPWYADMIKRFGNTFTEEFFYNDHIRRIIEAEHISNDTWFFYPIFMVLCMFPWSFFTVISFFHLLKKLKGRGCLPIYQYLSAWLVIVLVVFQASHSKLVSYIFPLFPVLALMTGDFIHNALSENKTRALTVISYISWATILVIPIGLVVCMIRFSGYIPERLPIYCFIIFYLVLQGAMLLFIKQKKFLVNMCFLAIQLPLILVFVFLNRESLNIYAAGKKAAQYLAANAGQGDNKILCAKFLARGVRFYTDREVAVIDMGGSNFFSPHPIPYLNTENKVRGFLKDQQVTYGIVTKSSLKALENIARNDLKLDKLKTIGDEHIVKVYVK
ncbi:MAG: hypothetical protein AUJ74_04520 [Candidatus Omnitrophica bacterium CG1_02_44_16]|nr:MAG: hypothetical protein AUJ74_04520 [Candidatus Omnitrophica bacterium CG1_02_44_16]PIY83133.1 MAG: hypothetical protein COY78_03250 [Candidatus Omnitrophica bacterium CG_4_10_14_0_8_um_filter_44_12]